MRALSTRLRRRRETASGQRVEVSLACKILNTITRLGMPESVCFR